MILRFHTGPGYARPSTRSQNNRRQADLSTIKVVAVIKTNSHSQQQKKPITKKGEPSVEPGPGHLNRTEQKNLPQ